MTDLDIPMAEFFLQIFLLSSIFTDYSNCVLVHYYTISGENSSDIGPYVEE